LVSIITFGIVMHSCQKEQIQDLKSIIDSNKEQLINLKSIETQIESKLSDIINELSAK